MSDFKQAMIYTNKEMREIPLLLVNEDGVFKRESYETRCWKTTRVVSEETLRTRPRNSRVRYLELSCMGTKYLVHRILASTFLERAEGYDEVRHLDDDIYNNTLENLVWGTRKQNAEDAVLNGKMLKGRSDPRSFVVEGFDKDGVVKHTFCGKSEIQESGFWQANLHRSCKTGKPYKGLYWRTI